MFVLFGINRTTKRPERVTASDSRPTLRRMWLAYESAAIGDLDGGADDIEVKRGTDRTHVAALSREIARAQRAHLLAGGAEDDDDEPADRDAKPDNVVEPVPPAEDDEPEDDPAPARAPALEISDDVPPDPPAVDERTLPAHAQRRSCIDAPCPVPGCVDRASPYLSVLPEPLRPLCARHRTHAQRMRARGSRSPSRAVAMVMDTARANLPAPPVTTAPEAPAVEPCVIDSAATHGRVVDTGRVWSTTSWTEPRLVAEPPPVEPLAPTSDGEPCVLRIAPQTEPRFVDLNGIFDRLDALVTPTAGEVVRPEALTRADLAAVLREIRGAVRVAFDVAIARLESPR